MKVRTSKKVLSFSVVFATIAILSSPAVMPMAARADDDAAMTAGAVFTMTNDTTANTVVAFQRSAAGSLKYLASYPTGGRGSGGSIDPLQSQSAMLLSEGHKFLFAVNAASGTISSFAVAPSGRLSLIEHVPSGGAFPVSLALHGDLLFVLNSAGGGNVTGFRVGGEGRLWRIVGSTRPMSGANVGGATIAFSPTGQALVATERGTGNLDTFQIESDGTAFGPVLTVSHGPGPFGAVFSSKGVLLVSEATSSSVSSYIAAPDYSLMLISGSVPTNFKAACWIVATRDGQHAYTADSASDEISVFGVDGEGNLTVLDASQTETGGIPLDMALSTGDRFLYALTAGKGTITGFAVGSDGSLTPATTVSAVPAASGQNGLAAF